MFHVAGFIDSRSFWDTFDHNKIRILPTYLRDSGKRKFYICDPLFFPFEHRAIDPPRTPSPYDTHQSHREKTVCFTHAWRTFSTACDVHIDTVIAFVVHMIMHLLTEVL